MTFGVWWVGGLTGLLFSFSTTLPLLTAFHLFLILEARGKATSVLAFVVYEPHVGVLQLFDKQVSE